jgi:hypothetical protein
VRLRAAGISPLLPVLPIVLPAAAPIAAVAIESFEPNKIGPF